MNFQQHLKRERVVRGWSQARMAQELGTTANSISVWERGLSLPSPYFRAKLCELLGKNALELGLVEGDDTPGEVAVIEQGSNVEQEVLSVERMVAAPFQQEASSVQEVVELESNVLPSGPLQPQRVYPPNPKMSGGFAPGKRFLLVGVICVFVLSVIGGTVLLILPHVLTVPDPYAPYKGSLVLADALTDQNTQVNWEQGWNANRASCQFKGGVYAVFQPRQGYFHACVGQLTNFKNFAYEVEMVLLRGDYGGILFRAVNSLDGQYYVFRVDADGSYVLKRYIDGTDGSAISMDMGVARGYHTGYGQRNLLAVVADGSRLTLYVNGQEVMGVDDVAYMDGQIGVVAGSEQRVPAEASFRDVRVWEW